jgi:hypothetical protein
MIGLALVFWRREFGNNSNSSGPPGQPALRILGKTEGSAPRDDYARNSNEGSASNVLVIHSKPTDDVEELHLFLFLL